MKNINQIGDIKNQAQYWVNDQYQSAIAVVRLHGLRDWFAASTSNAPPKAKRPD